MGSDERIKLLVVGPGDMAAEFLYQANEKKVYGGANRVFDSRPYEEVPLWIAGSDLCRLKSTTSQETSFLSRLCSILHASGVTYCEIGDGHEFVTSMRRLLEDDHGRSLLARNGRAMMVKS